MTGVCPDCGTPLPKDAALMGLCPQCLLSMALEDEENPTLQGPGPGGILGEDRLLATTTKGLLSIDLRDRRVVVLSAGLNGSLAVSRTGSFGFGAYSDAEGGFARFDLDGSEPRTLSAYGPASVVALDATETAVATGGIDGIVRVGPVSGGEPHLLFGHKGLVRTLAFSPEGRCWPLRATTRPSASGLFPTSRKPRRTNEAARSYSPCSAPGPT